MPALSDIDVHKISFVDRAAVRDSEDASKPQKFILWKAEGGPDEEATVPESETPKPEGEPKPEGDQPKPEGTEVAKDEGASISAAIALLKKNRSAMSEADKASVAALAKAEEPGKEAIDKSELPPAVRAYLEKQEATISEAVAKAESATALLKAEQVKIRKAEFIAKAEGFKHIPTGESVEEMGETLMKAEDGDAEARSKVTGWLGKAEVMLSKAAVWAETGSARVGTTGGAMERLAAKATELRKAEGDKITQEQAMAKVLDDPANADIYADYKREQRAVARDAGL